MRLAVVCHPGPAAGGVQPSDVDLRIDFVATDAGRLPDHVDAVVLAGGAPISAPIMAAVRAFAAGGGPVLGIGAGFQALCAAGLLPGALAPVPPAAPPTAAVVLRVEGQPTPFTQAIAAGRLLRLADARVEWSYAHPEPEALARAGQVVFRYVDEEGGVTAAAEPGGSVHSVAGVCDGSGRVVGLAAHADDSLATLLGAVDGVRLLASLREYLADLRARHE